MSMLDKFPVIPVIVIENADHALPLAEALLAGGLGIIEVTFRTAAAAESIQRIRSGLPEMFVGAGTVVTPEQAQRAVDAGSQFGLAPGTDPETIAFFKQHDVPFIPGVMTPSDVQRAYSLGCQRLKFFPAGAAGGPKMLTSMSAPYKNLGIKFCPTGGVTPGNLGDYLRLDNVFAVGGTWLAKPEQIASNDWAAISDQVKAAIDAANAS